MKVQQLCLLLLLAMAAVLLSNFGVSSASIADKSADVQAKTDFRLTAQQLGRQKREVCSDGKECKNGGKCSPPGVGVPCICPQPWTAPYCKASTNYCDTPQPDDGINLPACLNGGTCTPHVSTAPYFNCTCPPGFTGSRCEKNIDDCADQPCHGNGVCRDLVNAFTCSCYAGWESAGNCRVNHDDCVPGPCLNGGRCLDGNQTYTCDCTDTGFTGSRCQKNIDDCATNTCAHGVCTDLVKGFSCKCYPGWEGKDCSGNHDDCAAGACMNGGRCLDGNRTYTCDCTNTGFHGSRCENNTNDCAPTNPCANGGVCTDGVKNYTCKCQLGYSGKNCTIDYPDCRPSNNNLCSANETCLERSDQRLYGNPSLPYPFNGTFSYSSAAGSVCIPKTNDPTTTRQSVSTAVIVAATVAAVVMAAGIAAVTILVLKFVLHRDINNCLISSSKYEEELISEAASDSSFPARAAQGHLRRPGVKAVEKEWPL